jgi:hypothetical protein
LLPTFKKKFIHCNLSSTFPSINIIHLWTCDKIFLHVTRYSILGVKKYSWNILST